MGRPMLLELPARCHTRASTGSAGYRSGRNSDRDTPLIFSTAKTRRGGTSSHCEIAWAVMPSGAANAATPPAALIARWRASVLSLMKPDESIACIENQALLHCAGKGTLYNVDMTLGKRLKVARKKCGLTQEQIADKFDISPAAVSSWERDKTVPELAKLPALWKTLKVPPEWLLDGVGDPPEQDALSDLWDRLPPKARRQALRVLTSLVEDSDQAA